MKILLFGKNGQVGWELRRTLAPLAQVTAVDYPEINFTVPAVLRALVNSTNPSVVVNAAAYTAVDKAETETELCRQVNAVAPGVLAEAAKKIGALMVHYSTDYVRCPTSKPTRRIRWAPTGGQNWKATGR
jgi:dTDP-4-dehydrorhamnose reductase